MYCTCALQYRTSSRRYSQSNLQSLAYRLSNKSDCLPLRLHDHLRCAKWKEQLQKLQRPSNAKADPNIVGHPAPKGSCRQSRMLTGARRKTDHELVHEYLNNRKFNHQELPPPRPRADPTNGVDIPTRSKKQSASQQTSVLEDATGLLSSCDKMQFQEWNMQDAYHRKGILCRPSVYTRTQDEQLLFEPITNVLDDL